jgi:ABC-type multidrug transport system fused ATPase/permease subunit
MLYLWHPPPTRAPRNAAPSLPAGRPHALHQMQTPLPAARWRASARRGTCSRALPARSSGGPARRAAAAAAAAPAAAAAVAVPPPVVMGANVPRGETAGAVLVVDNVTLQVGERDLLTDVDWRLMPGHRVGLVGANGAGKSTLLKAMGGQRTVRVF